MICSAVDRFFTSNLHRGQTLGHAATQMRQDVASAILTSSSASSAFFRLILNKLALEATAVGN
jgi:hypothetical protein